MARATVYRYIPGRESLFDCVGWSSGTVAARGASDLPAAALEAVDVRVRGDDAGVLTGAKGGRDARLTAHRFSDRWRVRIGGR